MADDDNEAARAVSDALRRDDERLLKAVDELRAMEREKRRLAISSRTFHELAERVEQKAREVFRLAAQDDLDGPPADRLATASQPASTDEPIDPAGSAPDRA